MKLNKSFSNECQHFLRDMHRFVSILYLLLPLASVFLSQEKENRKTVCHLIFLIRFSVFLKKPFRQYFIESIRILSMEKFNGYISMFICIAWIQDRIFLILVCTEQDILFHYFKATEPPYHFEVVKISDIFFYYILFLRNSFLQIILFLLTFFPFCFSISIALLTALFTLALWLAYFLYIFVVLAFLLFSPFLYNALPSLLFRYPLLILRFLVWQEYHTVDFYQATKRVTVLFKQSVI